MVEKYKIGAMFFTISLMKPISAAWSRCGAPGFVIRALRRGTIGTLWDASESFEMDDVVFPASRLFLSPRSRVVIYGAGDVLPIARGRSNGSARKSERRQKESWQFPCCRAALASG
jgi:hypothetical protein